MQGNCSDYSERWIRKEAEEKRLRILGISEDTIKQLRVHDWKVFKSERRYYQRLQNAGTYLEGIAEAEQPSVIKTVEEFLNSVENQQLYQVLITVDRLTQQISLMKMQGYSTQEIALQLGITQKSVYRRIDRLKEKLKKKFVIYNLQKQIFRIRAHLGNSKNPRWQKLYQLHNTF